MSSEPPEEPQHRSDHILSPTSPKPIHFPTPTNIPVLEMQMDVGFNQTEAHMSDPATRNTEVRPDFWRDPNEQIEATDHASPFSTGGEAMDAVEESCSAAPADAPSEQDADSAGIIANATEPEPVPISNSASHDANSHLETESAPQAQPNQAPQPSSDPSVPLAEASASYDGVPDIESDANENDPAQAFNGAVDVQSLLDTLQTAPTSAVAAPVNANTAPEADGMTVATTMSPTQSQVTPQQAYPPAPGLEGETSPMSASGLGVPPSGLPPRPPPQEQPLIHPNYVHSQHIRDYHPHAAHPAFQPQHARTGSQGNVADTSSRNFVPPVHSPSSATSPNVPQPGSSTSPYPSQSGELQGAQNGQQQFLAATPTATTGNPTQDYAAWPYAGSPSAVAPAYSANTNQNMALNAGAAYGAMTGTPIESRREYKLSEGEVPRPEDRPWDAEVQRKYDRFIEDERKYVSEGRWEQFPQGSRLFVGNLSSEKVTKRDIFHVFHYYGDLAQISIKQAYGFVQFLRTEDCMRALDMEQGTQIRDKKIHLEVSKPQKNRPQNNQRRSRSPQDNNRGRQGAGDRYTAGSRPGGNRAPGRNDYRPSYRSPSPRGFRDRYDDRYRNRSRSPGYGRGDRYRRSPSPRRDTDDDLPLPKRAPRDVPDVQIIVLDSLERDFISWVEQAFSSRVRVDVLILSPRLSEQAVVRRQIVEGVVAVVKLTKQNQNTGKIGLQIFDRRQGAGNVKFEEYDGLDPPIAVELILRAKGAQAPPTPSQAPGYGSYGGQQYGAPPPLPPSQQYGGYGAQQQPPSSSYGQPPSGYQPNYGQQPPPSAPPGVPPNLQNLITNLDPNNLQNLLSAMNTPQSANNFGNSGTPNSAVQALQNNPALAGYLQQQHAQQQQGGAGAPGTGGAPNMQDILAKLGTYQR